jgi:hypothetical protein
MDATYIVAAYSLSIVLMFIAAVVSAMAANQVNTLQQMAANIPYASALLKSNAQLNSFVNPPVVFIASTCVFFALFFALFTGYVYSENNNGGKTALLVFALISLFLMFVFTIFTVADTAQYLNGQTLSSMEQMLTGAATGAATGATTNPTLTSLLAGGATNPTLTSLLAANPELASMEPSLFAGL